MERLKFLKIRAIINVPIFIGNIVISTLWQKENKCASFFRHRAKIDYILCHFLFQDIFGTLLDYFSPILQIHYQVQFIPLRLILISKPCVSMPLGIHAKYILGLQLHTTLWKEKCSVFFARQQPKDSWAVDNLFHKSYCFLSKWLSLLHRHS